MGNRQKQSLRPGTSIDLRPHMLRTVVERDSQSPGPRAVDAMHATVSCARETCLPKG